MKLLFTPAECDVLFRRVRWDITVEAVVDGDVVACTPHSSLGDVPEACLTVQDSKVPPARDVVRIHVHYNNERGPVGTSAEVVVLMRGVVDGDASKVIEWRGYLASSEWETQPFDQGTGDVRMLRLQTSGYAVMHATYTASCPRQWTGVQIGVSAAAVQRALDDYLF